MRQTHTAVMESVLFLQRMYIATGLFTLCALFFLLYATM